MSNGFIDGLGTTLARAREKSGLSPADVAHRLKLSARQIEAIEAEDWSSLPGEVFRRGFVRNYARLVELDPDELIRPVDREATATHTITAPSEGLAIGRSPITRWVALPLAGLLTFLGVVGVLYEWLSQGEETLVSPPSAPPSAAPSVSAPTPAADAPDSPLEPQPPSSPTAPGVVIQPLPLAPTPLDGERAGPAQAPVAEPAPAAEVEKNAARLRFLPGEDAWIQVVDGKGQRYSRLVRAGVEEQLTGQPPFRLVVGNAASVKLTYNGQQIDLTPFIGEKVARLTLE